MSDAKSVFNEIAHVTACLIDCGLCIDQNFPTMKNETDGVVNISISATDSLAVTLKNIPYSESYAVLRDNRSYNLKLIDGGLLQLFYFFKETELAKHRLAFFPSPDLLEYQNHPDIYELDEVYADVIERNIVTSPLRFDYDPENFKPIDHPECHLTIGQYKNCRVPVSAPLTPLRFTRFILSSFYSNAYSKIDSFKAEICFPFVETIHPLEAAQIHIRG